VIDSCSDVEELIQCSKSCRTDGECTTLKGFLFLCTI